MAIVACVIAFNEGKLLPACLDSLEMKVDRVVVVDGAFAQYEHTVPSSTDGTQVIAECYGAEWVDAPRAWADEVEKRNASLIGNPGDWYFVIDADERLQGELPVAEPGRYYAMMINTWNGAQSWGVRMFQETGDVRYEGAHSAVWQDGKLLDVKGARRWPPAYGNILHLKYARPVDYARRMRAYVQWRNERERDYKKRHRV